MINYRILKLDRKHGIPTYDAFMPITLSVLELEDCNCRVENIQDGITKYYFKLPENLHQYRIKNGKSIIEDRIYFSCLYLFKLNFINKPYPATYVINTKGKRLLKKYSNYKDRLNVFHSLIKKMKNNSKSKKTKSLHKSTITSFPKAVQSEINKYNQGLQSRILKAILDKNNPYFFEHVVVDLLAKMGYKGVHGNAITTKKSGDGGIDGVINQDPLGTRTVYLQAKMYNSKDKVSRPEIQQFNGALHSRQGVFITTSDYTEGAKREAQMDSIVIINGSKLAELMLEYHVGVEVQHTYQILNLDKDYFD